MPETTAAFRDHGRVEQRLEMELDAALVRQSSRGRFERRLKTHRDILRSKRSEAGFSIGIRGHRSLMSHSDW
jgi:hypothetical protein